MKNVLVLMVAAVWMTMTAQAGMYLGNSNWQNPYVPDPYTLGLWHFDEQPGTSTLTDATGRSPAGTMVPDAYGSKLDPVKTWKPGKFDNCASAWWNSGSDYNYGAFRINLSNPAVVPDPLAIGKDQDLTIEYWAKFQYTGNRQLIDKAGLVDYGINSDGGITTVGWYGSGGWTTAYGPTILTGQWVHYAITFNRTSFSDKDVVTFWMNGIQQGNPVEVARYMNSDPVGDLYLFVNSSGYNASLVDLDELRISNTIRYVPEPVTLSLLIAGGLLAIRRRK